MLHKMTDKIQQLKVPIPYDLGEINCYIIEGKNGYTIVDTGDCTEEAMDLWERTLDEGCVIEKVVITHAHTDHMGLADWFQKKYNAAICMSEHSYMELQNIQASFIDTTYSSPLSVLFRINGGPTAPEEDQKYHRHDAYGFKPDELFKEKQLIQLGDEEYESIWTPGHAPDHFSFYNKRQQILFVGDHILNSLNPIVMAKQMDDNPLAQYLNALDKVLQHPAAHVFPGHGEVVVDLASRIGEMKKHYQKRWRQIHHSIKKSGSTAYQISQQIYGTGHPTHRTMSAFLQTITNLLYLHSIDEVRMEEKEGIIYFYPQKI